MSDKTTAKYKLRDYTNFNLTFPEVDTLLDKIELIKRRKIKDNSDPINYIDPFNFVKTLKNPVNHLIIGRRGAGKTSLLLKVIEEIRKTNGLITIVDMQGKQRQSADLPLVEVLLNLFYDLKINLEQIKEWEPYLSRKTKAKYYKFKSLYYGLINKDLWPNKTIELDKLYHKIQFIINSLELIKPALRSVP
jgi:AAA+ ATPase superfamily predicted ATPase